MITVRRVIMATVPERPLRQTSPLRFASQGGIWYNEGTVSPDSLSQEEVCMIEMTIDSIRVSMGNGQRVVILKDHPEERYLFIWITPEQAQSIAQEMQGQAHQRPLTHDLLKNIIKELGGTVTSVTVTELRDQIYYARISIDLQGQHFEIDSRPSDAIALAVRVKCPIYAEEHVLDEAAVYPEWLERPTAGSSRRESADRPREQYNLDAFRDFIQSLDSLDDFGKE